MPAGMLHRCNRQSGKQHGLQPAHTTAIDKIGDYRQLHTCGQGDQQGSYAETAGCNYGGCPFPSPFLTVRLKPGHEHGADIDGTDHKGQLHLRCPKALPYVMNHQLIGGKYAAKEEK